MGALKEFMILGFTVLAFFVLIKMAASYLPDSGFFGALKTVVKSA